VVPAVENCIRVVNGAKFCRSLRQNAGQFFMLYRHQPRPLRGEPSVIDSSFLAAFITLLIIGTVHYLGSGLLPVQEDAGEKTVFLYNGFE
jgi:hypothetical protein